MKSPIKKIYEMYKDRALRKKAHADTVGHNGIRFSFVKGKGSAEAASAKEKDINKKGLSTVSGQMQEEIKDKNGLRIPAVMIPSSFITCRSCGRRALRRKWEDNFYVCPECGKYAPIGAYYRLSLILDKGSFTEIDTDIRAEDPLGFPGYKEKIERQEEKTGLNESVISAVGSIQGIKLVTVVLDSRFFMGSMSRAVGEKVTRAVEYAMDEKLPLLIFSASGGARMQEGIYSLMQMAKTTSAIEQFSEKGGLFISFLTNPTTGGVTASFATLGDITLAEPGALIGFAGPRVIEQTISRKLPKGFQRSEYLENHGFVDRIVERSEMRDVLTDILKLHADTRKFSTVRKNAVLENKG
ncbi:acetyl-CoA carboxylase, carboxyltransferase subunit beta [Oribacterium sp. C9]|uniref:acetyl-CoA carboxylase, carboxyltransferase subunit beta n=1 Tax=Oribacterium sp. C9 TaxID=1943579 RepID=UPI0026B51ECC|nr:acetyl-CoA carboxylase, carboxyltransferase subunit beta [Oribacterium sp. C9]